jgi:hypothetical protein
MAFLEGLKFTGKLGELTAYRMRGCSKIVLRAKGGPSAEQIKKSPAFKNTRYTMSEFGGCSRMGKHVRYALHPLKPLADNNFGSDINSIMRKVQLQDKTSLWGRRNIILSDYARILEGFPLNNEQPTFDSVVRNPVYYEMDRANRSAKVDIPELLRSINYFPQNGHALFRVIVTLGIVPDMTYDAIAGEYTPPKWFNADYFPTDVKTPWYPSMEGMPATTLALAVNEIPPDNGWSLMLSIGIQYGSLGEGGEIKEVKRFGTAKIVALVGRSNDHAVQLEPTNALEHLPTVQPSEMASPEEDISQATVSAASTSSPPAICYHYVSASAAINQPPATTYTYAYTVEAVTVADTKDEKQRSNRSPVRTVGTTGIDGYYGDESMLLQWPATDGASYESPFSTALASSSRYLMVGQWRL